MNRSNDICFLYRLVVPKRTNNVDTPEDRVKQFVKYYFLEDYIFSLKKIIYIWYVLTFCALYPFCVLSRILRRYDVSKSKDMYILFSSCK
jgi:hypothetical protein